MSDHESAALDHAWKWFEYHANQRVSLLRMFLITTGAVTTAYFAAFNAEEYVLSIGAATLGAIASFCFIRLDERSSQLVKLSEAVLDREQERLKEKVGYDEILIIKASEKKTPGKFRSHRQIFGLLFLAILAVYILGILLAFHAIYPKFIAWLCVNSSN